MGLSSAMTTTLCILVCICSLQAMAMATKPKTLHITHYTHEIRGGPNHSLLLSAGTNSANLSAGASFGSVLVYDNTITQTLSNASAVVGRAAGVAIGVIIPSPATNGFTRVQLHMEHIFEEGSGYPGSTLSVVGIFYSLTGPWEIDVPGGTGYFKGYRGYAVTSQESETPEPPPVYLTYKWDFYLSKTK